MDWNTDHKYLDIYRINHPDGKDISYLKDEDNRKHTDKGSRLDKFLLSEDLCIKEIEFTHQGPFLHRRIRDARTQL